ncbi:transcriptional regulatory protein OmpR [mine drainage metagenome]|uniref:Transcriptional regulatory protein OmpR n=1 Tax=mine drainage metagenome TaxID=410659 RepID=A0A1J5P807_9ZZZZ
MKILVVDDDEMFLAMMPVFLSAAGFSDFTLATSAKETVRAIVRSPVAFDLCLLDLIMPEIDGIELCRWLRNEPGYKHTPILMVTSKADKVHIDRAFAAGATDYVTKPIDAYDLANTIRRSVALVGPTATANTLPSNGVDFQRAVHLQGVPRLLDYKAAENYLLVSSRVGLLSTRIFAFKIRNIGKIFARSNSEDFLSVLTAVGIAISHSLKASEYFFAYAGEGAYVCVARTRTDINLGRIEQDVNRFIRRMHLTDKAGIPIDVHVYVGTQIRGGLVRSGRGAVDAMTIAIRKAEEKANTEDTDEETKAALFGAFDVRWAESRNSAKIERSQRTGGTDKPKVH